MANPDNRVGLIGAASLAILAGGVGLAGGVASLGFANEARRLQGEQILANANAISTGTENPQNKRVETDLGWSLGKSAVGGIIFVLGESVAVIGAASIYVNRKRPESEKNTSLPSS